MKPLKIVATKPNPAGRDSSGGNPLLKQLQGEWVDIQNIGTSALLITGYSVYHTAFSPGCQNPQYAEYWSPKSAFYVRPGEIVRIHSGREIDAAHMAFEDKIGAQTHVWTERNTFALNNGPCGDKLAIWFNNGNWLKIDEAHYDPFPPEGQILHRSGDRLAVVTLGALHSGYR